MKNKISIILGCLFLNLSLVLAQDISIESKIDSYISQVQDQYEIPGLTLCIVKNSETIYKKNFGLANIEHSVPISNNSIFRVYSLTKPIISVGIFQLVEQGKLSLEDYVSKYISEIPESWRSIQIKHLLTHSSGLPDMKVFGSGEKLTEKKAKETAFKQDLIFNKGEKYTYNQTNFWLLHRIIEKITGKKLSDYISKNQFENETRQVFFSSDSKQIVKNRVTSYFPFATGTMIIDLPTIEGDYMFAANGLNITLDEFVKWDKRLRENKLLKPKTMDAMWNSFNYSKSNKVFAHSWDKIILNDHESFGFTGSLVTAYRVFPKDDLSIFVLSNGLGKFYDIDLVVNDIATIVDKDIFDLQKKTVERCNTIFKNKGFSAFKEEFFKLKKEANSEINIEKVVNSIGYILLRKQQFDNALKVFIFNTKEYPNSANVYDSLGELFFILKKYKKAKENYIKAIKLGGTNGNAKEMLEKIKKRK